MQYRQYSATLTIEGGLSMPQTKRYPDRQLKLKLDFGSNVKASPPVNSNRTPPSATFLVADEEDRDDPFSELGPQWRPRKKRP